MYLCDLQYYAHKYLKGLFLMTNKMKKLYGILVGNKCHEAQWKCGIM